MSYSLLDELPDQTVDGKLVPLYPPGTDHCIVAQNIDFLIYPHVEPKGEVFIRCGLYLSERDLFIPDVMVLLNGGPPDDDYIRFPPDLVVEVLSPLTAQFDRGYKKRAYEKFGVKEYWLVCPVSRTVEIYLLKNGVLEFDHVYSVYPDWLMKNLPEEEAALIPTEFTSDLFPGLRFKLADIFGGMVAEIRQRCKEKAEQ